MSLISYLLFTVSLLFFRLCFVLFSLLYYVFSVGSLSFVYCMGCQIQQRTTKKYKEQSTKRTRQKHKRKIVRLVLYLSFVFDYSFLLLFFCISLSFCVTANLLFFVFCIVSFGWRLAIVRSNRKRQGKTDRKDKIQQEKQSIKSKA